MVPTKHEILLAIGGHIWWKNEFEKDVSNGWHFLNPELADRSYESDLGLWLAEISPAEQDWEHFELVQSRYTDFHAAAADVVQMALSGKIELAEASIRTGPYATASTALTLALRNWMNSVSEAERQHRLDTRQTKPGNPDETRLRG